ncbi:MAG: hypothetical protein JKY65_09605 [Planctomycetes bacterium]|nr:hypothetical protein [Planctomycetota bacterium]
MALIAIALLVAGGAGVYSAIQLSSPEAQALEAALAGGALLVDVRTRGEYERGHLEGALNLPVGELEARLAELPRDRPLVVY